MTRPKIKESLKRKGISISLSAELIKLIKIKTGNISAYIEQLIMKDLSEKTGNKNG